MPIVDLRNIATGTMRFSTDKLYATGYRHHFGIEAAQRLALGELERA